MSVSQNHKGTAAITYAVLKKVEISISTGCLHVHNSKKYFHRYSLFGVR